MKKIAISLIALAAVSTVAFAGENRGYDLRDSDTYFGKYSTQLTDKATNTSAISVMDAGRPLTNFERMKWTSAENENSGH